MRRRDFLKLIGACVAAPSALQSIPEKNLTFKGVPIETKPCLEIRPIWISYEINHLIQEIDAKKVQKIIMSKELFDGLKKYWNKINYSKKNPMFCGVPVLISPLLPVDTKNGKIHAIAIKLFECFFDYLKFQTTYIQEKGKDYFVPVT
jgi:hypothetical protein